MTEQQPCAVIEQHQDFELRRYPAHVVAEVTVRIVPERLSAAVSYTGRWSKSGYQRHLAQLEKAVTAAGLELVGVPRWARFDPPFKPWFLRRNEVLQDVEPRSQGAPRPPTT